MFCLNKFYNFLTLVACNFFIPIISLIRRHTHTSTSSFTKVFVTAERSKNPFPISLFN